MKDVLDCAGMKTAFGCAAPIGYVAEEDAYLVRQLRKQGAIIVGKTVTCELAGANPSRTKNPRSPHVTPGGSSSGSAAAVAAGLCHVGIGTQTGGSIIRPSSFCGVFAIKVRKLDVPPLPDSTLRRSSGEPVRSLVLVLAMLLSANSCSPVSNRQPTFQLLSRHTCLSTCPSLDTLGFMANDLDDLIRVMEVCTSLRSTAVSGDKYFSGRPIRVGVVRDPVILREAEEYTLRFLDATVSMLSSDAEAFKVGLLAEDIGIERSLELHKIIGGFEVHFKVNDVCTRSRGDVSERAKYTHRRGAGISAETYFRAVEEVDGPLRASFRKLLEDFDCLLLPSAPGEAPPLALDTTGDPVFNSTTTLLGFPAVTLPLFHGPNKLPVGMQIMGAPLEDLMLLEVAKSIWSFLSQKLALDDIKPHPV